MGIKYLTPDLDKVWAFDLEGNGLLEHITKVHCLCVHNVGTGEEFEYTRYEDIREFFERTKGCVYVGHNSLAFDAIVLNTLVGTTLSSSMVIDTLVMSWLYSPNLEGGHSIESYAQRYGLSKVGAEITDWSTLTPLMLERCKNDARLTAKIYKSLCKRMLAIGFSEQSVKLQHDIRTIMERQRKAGFTFNQQGAISLYTFLRDECTKIEANIHKVFPPELKEVKRGPYKLTKAGIETSFVQRYRQTYPKVEVSGNEYVCYDYVAFNLGSPAQRVERLLSVGWEPLEHTPKGSPKITEESITNLLESGKDVGPVSELIRWMAYTGRANMINTWLNSYNEQTGRIHGNLWVASTLRFRHDNPNTANIPGVRKDKSGNILRGAAGLYTYEARDLWTVSSPKTRKLVGVDAKGLEFRMLAHEVNDPEFTDVVCNGDIHEFMKDVYEIESRSTGKTLTYAIIYGGQDGKIGSIVGGNYKDGARIRSNAFRNLPGLERVTNRSQQEFYSGRISLVDGSFVICPSKHAALNYKLQGSGARVMALAAVLLDKAVRKAGLDAYKVCDVHDEWQWDVLNEHVDQFIELALHSLVRAGIQLNLNVPIEGAANVGLTWSETH